MRYAVISDIHANLEAFEAVRAKIRTLDIDRILCLGDIVGYNADPGACLEKVREIAGETVRGNHDKAVAGLLDARYFNRYAREAVRWSQRVLEAAQTASLRELRPGPLVCGEDMLLCHGAPQDEDLYLVSRDSIREAFDFLVEYFPMVRICFFGHTHVPFAADSAGENADPTGSFTLRKDRLYLINPGSVGQPRDCDPRAGFGVYDTEAGNFTFYRVPYPFTETQEKILSAGLPAVLAERLAAGR